MNRKFVSKIDLAKAYFPSIDGVSARHKLRLLMKDNKALMEKLKATGYKSCSHEFSPVQMGLVMDAFGDPFN